MDYLIHLLILTAVQATEIKTRMIDCPNSLILTAVQATEIKTRMIDCPNSLILTAVQATEIKTRMIDCPNSLMYDLHAHPCCSYSGGTWWNQAFVWKIMSLAYRQYESQQHFSACVLVPAIQII